MKHIQSIITLLTLTLFTHVSHAAVTATFTELENDIRVTFDGTLALDPTITGTTRPYVRYILVSSLSLVNASMYGDVDNTSRSYVGLPSDAFADVVYYQEQTSDLSDLNVGYFGYSSDYLYFDKRAITQGTATNVAEITLHAEDYHFLIEDHSLASLNLDAVANGAVLWTATTTGDTINFVAVPEPRTDAVLGGAFALGLAAWRKAKRTMGNGSAAC